jgi:small ligand-binding sensory domain FIST
MTAMQLLTAVQSQPNLPQSFRDNATQVANYAITYAQAEIANAQAASPDAMLPSAILEPISVPLLVGSSPSPMAEPFKQIQVEVESYMKGADGPYVNLFAFYLEDGKKTADMNITATADDAGTFSYGTVKTQKIGYGDGQPGAYFVYSPASPGERTLTFTANGVTKQVTVRGL